MTAPLTLRGAETVITNLGADVTSFIGRRRELVEVGRLLEQTRLLTLIGVGGCGKTRLAIQAALQAQDRHPDGVWAADLATTRDPVQVPGAVGGALGMPGTVPGPRGLAGLQESISPIRAVAEYLAPKHVLLILDNCEHVVDAVADMAAQLLTACPHLRVMATSRQALGVPGETVWSVPMLDYPRSGEGLSAEEMLDYDATRLFVTRAISAQASFEYDDEAAAAIARICRRLEGVPLAIELAAARIKVLTVQQIAERLDRRFELLTGGSAVDLPHHRTMRAAVDWSYDLLDDRERRLFTRLSVFRGDFSLAAAEAITGGSPLRPGDVLDLLGRLVDKSMLVAATEGYERRFRLSATLHAYASDRLTESGELDELEGAHTRFFADFAAARFDELMGRNQTRVLAELERERHNLRAVMDRALEKEDAETALQLVVDLYWLWFVHRHPEGVGLASAAVAMGDGVPDDLRGRALVGLGVVQAFSGDQDRAWVTMTEAVDLNHRIGARRWEAEARLYLGLLSGLRGQPEGMDDNIAVALELLAAEGNQAGMAWSKWLLGSLARQRGDVVAARGLLEEALSGFREIQDPFGSANCLAILGTLARYRGDYGEATARHGEALDLMRRVGDRVGIVALLGSLAIDHRQRGNPRQAVELLEEAVALAGDLGNPGTRAQALYLLGNALRLDGRLDGADDALRQGLAIVRGASDREGRRTRLLAIEDLAWIAFDTGRFERAVRLFAALDAGLPRALEGEERYRRDTALTTARSRLGSELYDRMWAGGHGLSLEAAADLALQDPDRAVLEEEVGPLSLEQLELGERVARALERVGERREVRLRGLAISGRRRRPSGERPPLPRELRASGWFWLVIAVTVGLLWASLFAWPETRDWWQARDNGLSRWILERRTDAGNSIMKALHALGSPWAWRPLRWVMALVLIGFRRWRHLLAAMVAFAATEGVVMWIALEIGRPRPFVPIIGTWEGYSHPAAAVASLSVTLAVAAYSVFPRGRWRTRWLMLSGTAVALLVAARVYLGVDHLTDGVVGALFGVAVAVVLFRLFVPEAVFPVSYGGGRTAHLDVAGARGQAIRRAFREQLGLEVLEVKPFGLEASGGSTPLRVTAAGEPETRIFAKLYASSHLRADRWYKVGRTILYGSLEDEVRFTSVRRLVEYEDYMLLVMSNAGVPSAKPFGVLEITPEREYMIVTEFLQDAHEITDAEVTPDIIDDALLAVRRMWDAGLAHRDLKPANIMVREGRVRLVDVAFGTVRPTPWRQAVDLANMMLVLSLRADWEVVYRHALRFFAPEDIAEAFAATRGITIPRQLRTELKAKEQRDGVDAVAEFRLLSPPCDPIHIQRWGVRRVALSAGAAMGGLLLLSALIDNFVRGGSL